MIQTDQLEIYLKNLFQYKTFRPGQKEIINDILKGYDVLGILPTGSGKSLCYQLPAKLLPGTTIVVSPLISLMIDQVKRLRSIHFKEVIALNSFIQYKHRRKIYQNLSAYKLIYISPELLQQEELLFYLQKLNVSLFVVDEAHCISQWGHEFRPDYLRLNSIIQHLNDPPVLALSATATAEVKKDIMQSLDKPEMIEHIYPIDRENLAFSVVKLNDDHDKRLTVIELVRKYHVPTLIYFSSRKDTERVAKYIAQQIPEKKVAFYHGGLEPLDRIAIQQQFMNDQLDLICCTSAFGMGIDKDNIRLIIHYHFPPQIESFIQEVGRAGRDGDFSVSVLLYTIFDQALPKSFIKQELPTDEQLIFMFQTLRQLVKQNQSIPRNIDNVTDLFQVNETQWRYLNFQLEKNRIIKSNHIYFDEDHWNQVFNEIQRHRDERLLYKNNQLQQMIHWVHAKNCLREELYKTFQKSFQSPTYHCCINCGFTFEKWLPEQRECVQSPITSWEDKLKTLLLGASNETE